MLYSISDYFAMFAASKCSDDDSNAGPGNALVARYVTLKKTQLTVL